MASKKKLKNIKDYTAYISDPESSRKDTIGYLYSLNSSDVNGLVNDLITSGSHKEKKEIIQDILLQIGDAVNDEDYHKIEDDLKENYLKNK